jgi:NAD(P)-dependent dehydrogenase (short-subunit alcohol dehydrogenase family)
MDYRDRHVVVTGGTGALGTATVGALLEAGAVCHGPYLNQAGADRFAFRNHPKVKLLADIELREETAVAKVYDSVLKLWASIHIAGGFAMAPITETTKSDSCCAQALLALLERGPARSGVGRKAGN